MEINEIINEIPRLEEFKFLRVTEYNDKVSTSFSAENASREISAGQWEFWRFSIQRKLVKCEKRRTMVRKNEEIKKPEREREKR